LNVQITAVRYECAVPILFAMLFVAALTCLDSRAPAAAFECLEVNEAQAAAFAQLRRGATCAKCKGCGCKGGPGFRAPPKPGHERGRCVSWRQLIAVCGPAPHGKCDRECNVVTAGCSRPGIGKVNALAKRIAKKRGCGSRGGSGYRGPNGRCVSKKQVRRVCGDPPTTRCRAENVSAQQ